MWGNARTRRKDFWTDEIDEEWTKTQLRRRQAAHKLLQLPADSAAPLSPIRKSHAT